MIKYSLTFLVGTMFSTLVMISAGGRAAQFIGLGFLLTVALTAGVLWLTGVRRLARFLNAFADGLASSESKPARQASSARQSGAGLHVADKSGYVKPSRKAQLQNMADAVEEYRERASKPGPECSQATDSVLREMFGEGKVA